MHSHRVLYAGSDSTLIAHLRDGLRGLDCFVVSAPAGVARTFIRSDIKYSLLIFDDTAAGVALESFARSLAHREHTPVVHVKKSQDLGRLLETVKRRLGTLPSP
jgi:hypothetical protein